MGPKHGFCLLLILHVRFNSPSLRNTALLEVGDGSPVGYHCIVISGLWVSLCTAATPTPLEDQRLIPE